MDFSERMAALRPRYLERCRVRMQEIAPLLADLDQCGPEDLTAIRIIVHDFAGTAGSLGFDEIGKEAKLADALLWGVLGSHEPISASQSEVLRLHASRLIDLLAEAKA